MKPFIFFFLIGFSLFLSLVYSQKELKNNQNPMLTWVKATLVNAVILGLGGVWWFFTETDGISQGIGVMTYLGSIVVLSMLDMFCIFTCNHLEKRK